MPTAILVSQGDEVVTGQIVDRNAAWLAEHLTDMGIDVVGHRTVGDRLADLVATYAESATHADIVLSTGGLGPTGDDLTAEAIAAAFDAPLTLDADEVEVIRAKFAAFGRTMPEVNIKQAMIPRGALKIDNPRGTAPGFVVDTPRGFVACMPGVPHEMHHMFESVVASQILDRFSLAPSRLITLRTIGLGESALQERIGNFSVPHVTLGYRASATEVRVKLRATADASDATLATAAEALRGRIGSSVFAVEGLGARGGSLIEVIARHLTNSGETLATAESCTGGRIASLCTSLSGSSQWFLEGVVTYSNEAKVRQLGVDPTAIAEHGAVSEPVARQMAEGIRARSGAHFALSTTGVAGPTGGTAEKPIGLVHMALATPTGTFHRDVRLPGRRSRVQERASAAALDLLRRHLKQLLTP